MYMFGRNLKRCMAHGYNEHNSGNAAGFASANFLLSKMESEQLFFLLNVAVLSSKNPICLALLVEKEEE